MPRIASSAALESRGKLLLALGSWREAWPCPWTDHCIEPGQRSPRMCSTIERAPCLSPVRSVPQRHAGNALGLVELAARVQTIAKQGIVSPPLWRGQLTPATSI
jgi:hypothetical protein